MAEPDELHRKMRKVERDLAENEAQRSRLIGRIEGAYDHFIDDPVHRELLRARAWLRNDPSLVMTYDGSKVEGAPNGWPETVANPDEHVAADIAARREAHVERLNSRPSTSSTEPTVSPSVARFREMTGMGDEP